MRWGPALAPAGQSAAGPLPIRTLLPTFLAPQILLLVDKDALGGIWRANCGLSASFFGTRRYLSKVACREWPLNGRHFSKLYFRFWPVSVAPADWPAVLHLRLLRHFESVVDLDPEVADRAFQLCVPEQQLNGPKILGAMVDQRRLGAPQRVRPLVSAVEAELLDPRIHNSGVLASRQVSRSANAARKQPGLSGQPGRPDPGGDRVTGRLRDLKLHRTLGSSAAARSPEMPRRPRGKRLGPAA